MNRQELFLALLFTAVIAVVALGIMFHLAEKETTKQRGRDDALQWRLLAAVAAVAATVVLVTLGT